MKNSSSLISILSPEQKKKTKEMKKEGRQNGTTYRTVPPEYNPSRPNNYMNRKLESPPLTPKAQPNNHSKFKGKCGSPRCNGCHLQRSSKSEEKTKGYYKKKPCAVVSNQKLLTWRVVHNGPGLKFGGGVSASDVLDHLATQEYYDGYGYGSDDDYDVDSPYVGCGSHSPGIQIPEKGIDGDNVEEEEGEEEEEEEEKEEDEYDDGMSFCDVGILVDDQIEGDEDWCFVDEL